MLDDRPRVDPGDREHLEAALIRRVAEGERRLAIYGRRVLALKRGQRLAPGQASAGLEAPRLLEVTNMAGLSEKVDELFVRLGELERHLLEVERVGSPRDSGSTQIPTAPTARLTAPTKPPPTDPTEQKRVQKREEMRRYRERKKGTPK